MTRVYIGLSSKDGDRLGHLVRGVQMLRSYGDEAHVMSYSDVVDYYGRADEPPSLCCVLECSSESTLEELRGMARETEWALGDEPGVLQVRLLKYGDQTLGPSEEPFQALMERSPQSGPVANTQYEFASMCDWGQHGTDGEDDVIGEWPSATGR